MSHDRGQMCIDGKGTVRHGGTIFLDGKGWNLMAGNIFLTERDGKY